MSNRAVARRYARALFEEARQAGTTSESDQDVALIEESLAGSKELVRFLRSPIVSGDKKKAVITQLFGERVQPLTLRFLTLLIDKDREDIVPSILEAYRTLRDEEEGIVEAVATVPGPLAEREEGLLRTAVEGLTGKRVRLRVQTDSSLIGGVIVRVGDTVYDGSVAHQLENLRVQMRTGKIATNGAA